MSERTFVVKNPLMEGEDVRVWQTKIKSRFKSININCPITIDGVYGMESRSYSAALCSAYGYNPNRWMNDGLTSDFRKELSKAKLPKTAYHVNWRKNLRQRWGNTKTPTTALPVDVVLADSWGYHPGVHDGVDVLCKPDAQIYAMVKCKVIDVRSSGWWGKGAPSNPSVKAKGDGIIQLEVLENVGPFKKGQHIGYGHAEKASVKVGQTVNAGQKIGHAGMANAWHIHLMVNAGGTKKGVGTQDPRPFLNYVYKHGKS